MELLKFEEAEPASLPALEFVDDYDDTITLDLDPALWRRLESYTAWRWRKVSTSYGQSFQR